MKMRERPRIAAMAVEQLLLVADRAVGQEHDLAQLPVSLGRGSVSAAFIAGTISVPPRASQAVDVALGPPTCWASAGTVSGNSTVSVSSKRTTLKRSSGCRRPSA